MTKSEEKDARATRAVAAFFVTLKERRLGEKSASKTPAALSRVSHREEKSGGRA
jgi:hypothetical protein